MNGRRAKRRGGRQGRERAPRKKAFRFLSLFTVSCLRRLYRTKRTRAKKWTIARKQSSKWEFPARPPHRAGAARVYLHLTRRAQNKAKNVQARCELCRRWNEGMEMGQAEGSGNPSYFRLSIVVFRIFNKRYTPRTMQNVFSCRILWLSVVDIFFIKLNRNFFSI